MNIVSRLGATPCSQVLNHNRRKMAPVPRRGNLRGGNPSIGGTVVAGGGDHWARPHARLLARAGDRTGAPAKS